MPLPAERAADQGDGRERAQPLAAADHLVKRQRGDLQPPAVQGVQLLDVRLDEVQELLQIKGFQLSIGKAR